MAKYLIFVFIAVLSVLSAFAAPAEEVAEMEALPVDLEPGMYREFDAVVRMTRVTCDVLSAWGVNHTACAIHCIFLGYKGGRCINGVCNCRN